MALIPYIDPESAPETMRKALDRGTAAERLPHARQHRGGFWPYVDYNAALLAKLELDPVLRELAILRVAALDRLRLRARPSRRDRRARSARRRAGGAGGRPGGRGGRPRGPRLRASSPASSPTTGRPASAVLALNERLGPGQVVELMMAVTHYHGLAALAASVEMEIEEADGLSVLAGAEDGWQRD